MDKTVNKKNKSKQAKNAVTGMTRPEKFFYYTLEHPNEDERKLARMAGYSDKSDLLTIKATLTYKRLRKEYFNKDIETRIKEAQERAGSTIEQRVGTLNEIRKTGDNKDRISAIKLETDITGEKRPEQVEHAIPGIAEALGHLLE